MKSFSTLASKVRAINTNFDSFNLIGEVNIQPRVDLVKKRKKMKGGGKDSGDGLMVCGEVANKSRGMEDGGREGEKRYSMFRSRGEKNRGKTNRENEKRETATKKRGRKGEGGE